MKRVLCAVLILMLIGTSALAVPRLSNSLFSSAKQAVAYLASGEYERLVKLLPFSGVSPSAAEWESFARNYSSHGRTQQDYAVAYWKGDCWRIAVPLKTPNSGSVEVLVLLSEDGSAFSGYRYATWSKIESEYASSDHVIWNQEYSGGKPKVVADGN